MTNVPVTPEGPLAGAYCAVSDLRTGDIRLPSYIDPEQRVRGGADEIDIALGHLYVTPITFGNPVPLKARPSMLTLRKINWLITSGRIILDMAASGENQNQHAYGMGMLKEGLDMLKTLKTGNPLLVDAVKLPEEEGAEGDFTGAAIFNQDPVSLVESFYSPRDIFGNPIAPAFPYGIVR